MANVNTKMLTQKCYVQPEYSIYKKNAKNPISFAKNNFLLMKLQICLLLSELIKIIGT